MCVSQSARKEYICVCAGCVTEVQTGVPFLGSDLESHVETCASRGEWGASIPTSPAGNI